VRVLLQRTSGVEIWIDGQCHSKTGSGLLLLFGTQARDSEKSCSYLAEKVVNLRIFEDEAGKMNLSALDLKYEIMIVSQFTLYADTRKGRRPSFNSAMEPVEAELLYNKFIENVKNYGLKVESGIFGAKMDLRFNNDGPVTILLEHED
jgi:D-tyrosyl-tRNA(Tyr) deacylase